MIFALGFLVLLVELVSLARTAFGDARYESVARMNTWTGGRYFTRVEREPSTEEEPLAETEEPYRLPLMNPPQLAAGLAAWVVGLAAFFPQVVRRVRGERPLPPSRPRGAVLLRRRWSG